MLGVKLVDLPSLENNNFSLSYTECTFHLEELIRSGYSLGQSSATSSKFDLIVLKVMIHTDPLVSLLN